MGLHSLLTPTLFCMTLSASAAAQIPQIPADAPTSTCDFPGGSIASLRIVSGDGSVPFVMSCPGHAGGRCNSPIDLTSRNPNDTNLVSVERNVGGWTCSNRAGIAGWIPSARLSPLPERPAIPEADWQGWWRRPGPVAAAKTDHILITRSHSNPGALHVSGRGYWYGIGDNVHSGQIDGDAQARGPYLHIGDSVGCTLNLIFQPATHTFLAIDNAECGGMNVRFTGRWVRFQPTPRRVSLK